MVRNKGFTLIELIIVIAIIGILISVAMPAIQEYLNRDDSAVIQTQQKTNNQFARETK